MTDETRSARVDATTAWATPLDAPMYPRYPVAFRDLEFLTLQYRTDPEAIRRLLPEPLEPTGELSCSCCPTQPASSRARISTSAVGW